MAAFVLALDQGTTSSRAIVFDHDGSIVSVAQKEFAQIFPQPGWVEHDPEQIWSTQLAVARSALKKAGLTATDIAAIGITNQRETTVLWSRSTGKPVYNAIVWQDRRTAEMCDRLKRSQSAADFRERTGLVIDSYFSGTKIAWLLEHIPEAKKLAKAGDLAFGTIDSWLLWKLTGGRATAGAVHKTDISNASRTLVCNIRTGKWDPDLLKALKVPDDLLPEICSSSEVYAETVPSLFGRSIPVAGIAGDQQAALFGQMCTRAGMVKNTYGTGCFMLMNTGEEAIFSENGLLTTVCYKIGDQPTVYALEGSIAVAGSLVQWLRDNLKMFETAPQIEALANTVEDNGGAYFVPAFSGLFAPYWRPDARGALVGLTRYVNRGHIARAVLESTAFQTREVLEAMNADSGVPLTELRVDGGMTANETLMQFQADQVNVPVVRPVVAETTALGAAYAAGIAVGFWEGENDVTDNWAEDKRWEPKMDKNERERLFRNWKKAVTKTFDWVDDDVKE